MKPRFNPLAILALIAVAALLTAAVVPSSFVFPTRQAVQTLTGSRALVSNSSGLLTNSTVTSTELGYVSGVTSAIQTQLDAKATAANLTTVSNTVTTQGNTLATNTALLNGTNTFTGTNNFTGAVIITNAGSTISGDGAGLTNLSLATNSIIGTNVVNDVINFGSRWRCIYMAPSNYFTGTAGVAETNFFTNITIPPLMSSNSIVVCGVMGSKTNLTSQPLWFAEFRDTTTNGTVINGVSVGGGAAAGGAYAPHPNTFVFANCNSFTYQWVPGTNYQVSSVGYNLGWNTQNTNTLSVLVWHSATANCAPLTLHRFGIWEIY